MQGSVTARSTRTLYKSKTSDGVVQSCAKDVRLSDTVKAELLKTISCAQ